MTDKKPTLLSIGQTALTSLQEEEDPLIVQLNAILARYLANKKRDAESFLRYSVSITNAIAAASDVSPRRARMLTGDYLAAGIKSKRSAGNPRNAPVGMFLHLWHEIASARGNSTRC